VCRLLVDGGVVAGRHGDGRHGDGCLGYDDVTSGSRDHDAGAITSGGDGVRRVVRVGSVGERVREADDRVSCASTGRQR